MHATDKRAATDVEAIVSDLEAGLFAQQLSVALSEVAASVVDHERKGKVKIELAFEHIKGTHQVRVEHKVSYERPTTSGRAGEETKGATVLHVGKGGRLSLAQPSLLDDDKKRQQSLPGTN